MHLLLARLGLALGLLHFVLQRLQLAGDTGLAVGLQGQIRRVIEGFLQKSG